MIIESSSSKIPLLVSSTTLSLSPTSRRPIQCFPARTSAASSSPFSFHHRLSNSISISFSRRIPCFSSLTVLSPRLLASISSATSFSGGGGDELPGSYGGGGGGDGGSSGRVVETGSFAGETEEDLDLGPDVIFINVGGMTCGGCAASVKRILESQPHVASATVYLEKEIAVVWTVSEAKVIENWQQQIGEKLANHLTTCGFKSEFQEGSRIEELTDMDASELKVSSSLKFLINSMKSAAQSPLTSTNYLLWSSHLTKLFKTNGYSNFLSKSADKPSKFLIDSEENQIKNPQYDKWILIYHNLAANI